MIRLTVDLENFIAPIPERLFGSMVEHMGRSIYGGIFDEEHPAADAQGVRTDVKDLASKISPTVLRYPGGNYASSYRWEDSVGPPGDRPTRLDLAWQSVEPNKFGLAEFSKWARDIGAENMMTINLGTRGTADACNLLEYTNYPGGTYWSDLRRSHGEETPYNIKLWALGNEVDGPWQIGHTSAWDYAKHARETAKAMRRIDGAIELALCGTSNSSLPTYGQWDKEVIRMAGEEANFLSTHAYFEQGEILADYLASAATLQRQIDHLVSIIDGVQWQKPMENRVKLSLDEYNIWFVSEYLRRIEQEPLNHWEVGSPRGEEKPYSPLDAVIFATLMHTIVRSASRVGIACQAQLVNVLGMIRTTQDGKAHLQSIAHPFLYMRHHAKGFALGVDYSGPTYATTTVGRQPVIDATATWCPEQAEGAVFIANLDPKKEQRVVITIRGSRSVVATAQVLVGATTDTRVPIKQTSSGILRKDRSKIEVRFPSLSWGAIHFKSV